MVAWTAYEIYETAQSAYDAIQALQNGDLTEDQLYEAAALLGIDIAAEVAIDLTLGKLKVLERGYELIKKAGLGDKADDIAQQIENNKYNMGNSGGAHLPQDVKSLSEANITGSGKTVLGHFPEYVTKAKSEGSSYFDIGDAWNDLTPDQRWAANTNFLDRIAEKGDVVNLSIPKQQIRADSYLAKEIEYLTSQKGYKWVNQWSLKP